AQRQARVRSICVSRRIWSRPRSRARGRTWCERCRVRVWCRAGMQSRKRRDVFPGGVMAVEVKVPSVGESITEGVLSRWLKKDGDAVRSGEPLFELETDKATQEVPSPADGVLSIAVKEGEQVAIGSVVGSVDPAGRPKPRKTDNELVPAKAE